MFPGQTFQSTFTVTYLGILADADGLPVATLYRNAMLTSIAVTVTHLGLGTYGYGFEIPNNWGIGDVIDLHVFYGWPDLSQQSTKGRLGEVNANPTKLEEIHQLLGLDPDNPVTIGSSTQTTGDITLEVACTEPPAVTTVIRTT